MSAQFGRPPRAYCLLEPMVGPLPPGSTILRFGTTPWAIPTGSSTLALIDAARAAGSYGHLRALGRPSSPCHCAGGRRPGSGLPGGSRALPVAPPAQPAKTRTPAALVESTAPGSPRRDS